VGERTEMRFKTESGVPVVEAVEMDHALLSLCRLWENVGALTAQRKGLRKNVVYYSPQHKCPLSHELTSTHRQ